LIFAVQNELGRWIPNPSAELAFCRYYGFSRLPQYLHGVNSNVSRETILHFTSNLVYNIIIIMI